MSQGALGNLEQWGRALEKLEEWRRGGQLDQHRDDLLWLLRYRDNWRLREAALEAMADLRTPDETLIREACSIMMDEGLYHELRVLAAEAVARVLAAGPLPRGTSLSQDVRERMHALLNSQRPPVMHQAIRRILPSLE